LNLGGNHLSTSRQNTRSDADREFLAGLARAFGGAIIFSLPILMTMEMWHLGFFMDRLRLALLLTLTIPLLIGLSIVDGFRETNRVLDDVIDAFVALAVGLVTGAVALLLFGVIEWGEAPAVALGKVALQVTPASIGALLAQSTFGQGQASPERESRRDTYQGELLLMCIGALFLGLPVAATEEMVLIAYRMSPWQQVAMILLSLAAMHAFVYAAQFRGQEPLPPGTPAWTVFLRFTVVGYALTLLVCAYVLWSFGRLGAPLSPDQLAGVVVLAFPGAIGAAAARVIL